MKIALFQFHSSGDIASNFAAIKHGILQAANQKARLLTFHECALSGYPPLETDFCKIDFHTLDIHTAEIRQLAKAHDLYIALGTIRKDGGKAYNSTLLINPRGEI